MAVSLDCWYCGQEFPDFAPLAIHVQKVHFRRTNYTGKGGIWDMDVSKHTEQGDRAPLLDAALFRKLKGKDGKVVGKVLAVREVTTDNFKGLALDLKNGTTRFNFLCSFARFDIAIIARQLDSTETDDWLGRNVSFVTKKATDGRIFVNVESPKKGRRAK